MITAASPSAEMAPLEIIDAAAPSGDAAELSDELHAGSGRAQVATRFDHEWHNCGLNRIAARHGTLCFTYYA